MPLFLLFLSVPLIELYLLLKIGAQLGALITVFLVIFTAAVGAILVRAQGFATLARVQAQLARAESPALEILQGVCLFIAGVLLLTPGFATDAIGFVLLVPSLRRAIIRFFLARRMPPSSPTSTTHTTRRVIDGEYKNLD